MDELVAWLGVQLDEDEQIALTWPADQRNWNEYGDRRIHYASGAGEGVSAVNVKANAALGWERIYVKRDGIGLSRHVAEHDPARVLREINAKRRIIELCAPPLVEVTGPGDMERSFVPGEGSPWGLDILKLLALPYADRPGYREDWRP
ncbi:MULTISPECIES: DUF6221 family protein [unclassified Streptomyces]|uniref:DUF6221 family protein n=2 Tax=Streptomyces TaxID=1883 RepID=UPI001E3A1C27|nr:MULTISPECIES: DUF6221 family protein [unclassified Streptomyces]WPP30014.1 DUF6221 family protein [Streptomyces sp. CL7]